MALNNQQGLICHKIKSPPNYKKKKNPKQTRNNLSIYLSIYLIIYITSYSTDAMWGADCMTLFDQW